MTVVCWRQDGNSPIWPAAGGRYGLHHIDYNCVGMVLSTKSDRLPESAVLVLSRRRHCGATLGKYSDHEMLGEDLRPNCPTRPYRRLRAGREDIRIKALLLDCSKLQSRIEQASGHRSGLEALPGIGKPVIAAADFYTQRNYYLAAIRPDLPESHGGVLLTVLGYTRTITKQHRQAYVRLHVFRVGSYKSALEPLCATTCRNSTRRPTPPAGCFLGFV